MELGKNLGSEGSRLKLEAVEGLGFRVQGFRFGSFRKLSSEPYGLKSFKPERL